MIQEKLVRKLVIEDENRTSVVDFLKLVDLKLVVDLLAESWDEISTTTLRKLWRKIILLEAHEICDEETDLQQEMREFEQLGDINNEELDTWLDSDITDAGFQLMNDEICEYVTSESLDQEEEVQEREKEGHRYKISSF